MPTSFLGLFLLPTALSLITTFTIVGVQALIRRSRRLTDEERPRLR